MVKLSRTVSGRLAQRQPDEPGIEREEISY
jgi:hypothetical protein